MSYEEEARTLLEETLRKHSEVTAQHPSTGRDGPAAAYHKKLTEEFNRKLEDLCRKYGRPFNRK